ncbi:MAG: ATP-binding cassette domain-containing protein [bacterium]
MEPLIIAKGLTKKFGEIIAVKGIDFTIYKGECFGFLGPNGAGKTSTMRMMYGFSPMTSGVLKVMGMDIRTSARFIKEQTGVVSQENNLDTDLTLMENLLVYSRYFNIPKKEALARARDLIEFMQLGDKTHSLVEHLSGGLKRRLVLARSLINSPSLLLLDEPTSGLDPQARHLIWQRLRSLKKTGVSMILTTHYMEEAAQLCDRIAVMDHGKIIAAGLPREMILKHVGAEIIELRISPDLDEGIRTSLRDLQLKTDRFGDTFYIYIPAEKHLFSELAQRLIPYNHTEMVHRQATLEDLFLQLTGRELVES